MKDGGLYARHRTGTAEELVSRVRKRELWEVEGNLESLIVSGVPITSFQPRRPLTISGDISFPYTVEPEK